jgi:two-component system, LytTR family, sensor kinase
MSLPTPSSQLIRRTALYLLACTGLAVLFSGQYVLERIYKGQPIQIADAFRGSLMYIYIWAALAWPLYRLGARTPRPNLVLLGAIAAGCAVLHILLRRGISVVTHWEEERTLQELFAAHLYVNLIVAFAVVVVSLAVPRLRRAREEQRIRHELEISRARVEAQLAQAELQLLKNQLHPHFLFNALNAISALIQQDVRAADRILGQLSELLRHALDTAAIQEWTLHEEVELLERYLDIQQTRFGTRLRTTIAIDPRADGTAVPSFILQPIVENAIEHAVARRRSGGVVQIRGTTQNEELCLEVEDDGADGIANEPKARSNAGIGLANTSARLTRLYGDRGSLAMVAKPAGGSIARLTLPIRTLE